MNSIVQKRAELKNAIRAYLKTCERQKCRKLDIWNNVSLFMNKQLAARNYGIRKMHLLLEEFSNILVCDEEYVYLRQQRDQNQFNEAIVIDSDSDEENSISASSSLTFVNNSVTKDTVYPKPDLKFREQMINVLLAQNGKCSFWEFLEKYQAEYGLRGDLMIQLPFHTEYVAHYNDHLFLQPKAYAERNIPMKSGNLQNASNMMSMTSGRDVNSEGHVPPAWGSGVVTTGGGPSSSNDSANRPGPASSLPGPSGFLPFSDCSPTTSTPRPALVSHQRYGLRPTPGTFYSVPQLEMPLSNPLRPAGRLPTVQDMAQNFIHNFRNVLDQSIQGSALASPALFNPQMAVSPLMSPEILAAQPNIPVPIATEWPSPSKRTGPPPGTKIIDDKQEVIIKPISLPRGARLTLDQVNYQVQECIDVLSEAKEHVSLERLEQMLLQKYQVRSFQALNLKEKYFENLPAAREHGMLLGKVNSYIQSFVRSRSLSTLYELKECCREFHPEKKEFEHLKLGPLQKMPVIEGLFKFPMDEYIPEITSIDIIEHLHDYLDKTNTWTKRVNLDEFMAYLLEVYHISSALSLGVRIRSIPLAIQMLKKSKRDAAAARKLCSEEMQKFLTKDIKDAFMKFRASILQTSQDGGLELRRHYMNLSPEDTVKDIITKFELLTHILMSNSPNFRKCEKMLKHFNLFVQNVLEVPIPRMLYHLSVCLSDLQIQESAQEFMELEAKRQGQEALCQAENTSTQQKKIPPTKVGLTEKVVYYFSRCLEHGSLQLSHLGKIESKVVEDFSFSSFQEMGYGRFLEYILSEPKIKIILEECGGTVLGSSSGGHEADSIYKPSQLELLEFVCQTKHACVAQIHQVENAICAQFRVTDLRHLGHGNITRLCNAAERPGKHVSKEYCVHFEAALCGKHCPTPQSTVGILGHQMKERAMACLTSCPLLEDMMEWSHWSLVFQPQFGPIRSFIEKYGGIHEISIEDGHKTAISDFMALEVKPGKFLKICSQATQDQFCEVLDSGNPIATAGYLVSLIVANKGLESTPMALLANHIKTRLIALHARSPNITTAEDPPSFEGSHSIDFAVQFVTEMLLRLPVRICVAIANQVLLEPLSSVVGSAKSKKEILLACRLPAQIQRLELLGCLLGLHEWTSSLQLKFEFPSSHLTEVMGDELTEPANVNVQEEEEEAEPDEESESDIDSILSNGSETPLLVDLEEKKAADEEKNLSHAETGFSDENKEEKRQDDDEDDTKDKRAELNSERSLETIASVHSDENHGSSESSEGTANYANGSLSHEDVCLSEPHDDEICVEEEEKELTREEICHNIVEIIQKEEFGLGIKLDETGEKLMRKQQERQGRSLQRLSRDLYSKETHFVLELIQNADDNSYDSDIVPAVKFVIDCLGVTVLNNEMGFEEKNIRAICDVGKSTKQKHTFGYIGQKGIGFKSVFRVTGRPEIHSNGFHIRFDVDSGPMGYILPHWISESQEDEGWQTRIVLPWTEEIKQQIKSHAARFNDIQPSLLLFLHRLKAITIENKVESIVMAMRRTDLPDGEVQITHSGGTDRWLVLRKVLDASGVSIQMKSGVEVESTEIALAFPLRDIAAGFHLQTKPPKLPVFAFLPLRSYGFRFIVQGDFDVPSSREDVDRDSSWNQWLRNEIHVLFVEALDAFKARPDLSPIKALIQYLQFIPLEGEVMDFFKPVATKILALLRSKECMPILTGDKKAAIKWKMPSKTVITKDALVREIISPELLQRHLGLYYLHPEVAAAMDESLIQVLGVEKITTEHLLHIGQSIGVNWDDNGGLEQVTELAKWLACVYRSLDDFQDNIHIIDKLCSFRIIPLSDGTLVSLSDVTVFLLSDGRSDPSTKTKKKEHTRDPLWELKKDLNLVNADLTNTCDNEINSQVIKLLHKMGIKQMTAHDLIHGHIMPVLKSEAWKEKKRDVLISYLVYIKTELDSNTSVVDMSELRAVVRLATNHGMKSPETDDIHFSPTFGNEIDLYKIFPGIEWTLVDSAYLPHSPSQFDRQSWHNFLSDLGVVDFLRVRKTELLFDKTDIHETAWVVYRDLWPDSPDGYMVLDFQCEEFYKLVTANQKVDRLYEQMVALYEILDREWDGKYKCFAHTQLKSRSGHVLKDVIQSSFALYLETLAWVPSLWKSVTVLEDGKMVSPVTKDLLAPAELYIRDNLIHSLLAHTVKYLNVNPQKKSSFTKYLKVKSTVDVTTVKEALISWCTRDKGTLEVPKTFCTTLNHVLQLYLYLSDNLTNKEAQDLFHNHPAIFVPIIGHSQVTGEDILVGRMLKRDEVWWADPTDLFIKYADSLELYKSPLAKRKFLHSWYPQQEEMFERTARVEKEPSTYDLSQLLKHIATVHSITDAEVLKDTLFLFSKIGSDLSKITDTAAGVKTSEAQKAETNKPKVINLLTKAAVFPSKQGQWVSLSDQPMIADSAELEQMFEMKPGVHFLQLEVAESRKPRDRGLQEPRNGIDKSSLKYCMSLFESIKFLSDCVKTEEITSHFQQCSKGQKFLHDVVQLLQRFLYYMFPEIHEQVKEKKAGTFKELLFSQVKKLEVRYELIGRPDVFEIRQERCVVRGKHFYFHEEYISSQADINREVAKFFSEGDDNCFRELRSFLSQVVPILEGKSDETMEECLARQKVPIKHIPADEEVWEIPPPIIEVVPEPEPVEEEMPMVYGRALSVPGVEKAATEVADIEKAGIKSWPPNSNLFREPADQFKKHDGVKHGVWPPPQGLNYAKMSKLLPSNIKFENSDQKNHEDIDGGSHSVSEQSSQVPKAGSDTEGKGIASQDTYSSDGRVFIRQSSDGVQSRDESGKTMRSGDGEGRGAPRHTLDGASKHAENRGDRGGTSRSDSGVTGDRSQDTEATSTGDKRKRKLTEGSTENEAVAVKKLNSQESDHDLYKQSSHGGVIESQDMSVDQAANDVVVPGLSENTEEVMEAAVTTRYVNEGSSGREVTPSSGSNTDVRRQNKKNTLLFTIPVWSDTFEDVTYTELSKGHDLTIPPISLSEDSPPAEIGQWGEKLVLDYLQRQKQSNSQIAEIVWANAHGERGFPYDFEIVYLKEDVTQSIFIEVKSTLSWDKEVFPVSSKQIEFAMQQKDCYEIYRVFGAGNIKPKLVRVDNVAEKMRSHAVRLYMVL